MLTLTALGSLANRVIQYQMDYSESLITCIRVVNSSQHLNFPSPWEKDGGCDIYSKRLREEISTRLSFSVKGNLIPWIVAGSRFEKNP